jgi:hypothetical protein
VAGAADFDFDSDPVLFSGFLAKLRGILDKLIPQIDVPAAFDIPFITALTAKIEERKRANQSAQPTRGKAPRG